MKAQSIKTKPSQTEILTEEYYSGRISAEDFVKKLEESKDGDRRRRRIEQEGRKVFNNRIFRTV